MGRGKASRKFNGKPYIFARTHRTKSEAVAEAKQIRRSGVLARVTKIKHGYEVWYRRK